MKFYVLCFSVLLFIFCSSLFFANNASASEIIVSQSFYDTYGLGLFGREAIYQSMDNGSLYYNQANKLEFKYNCSGMADHRLHVNIYEGVYSSCDYWGTNCPGSQVSKWVACYEGLATSTLIFPTIALDNTKNHFISIRQFYATSTGSGVPFAFGSGYNKVSGHLGGRQFDGSSAYNFSIEDMVYKLSYDNELNIPPDYEIDITLSDNRSDIAAAPHNVCYINEDCKLWFSFNDLAVGNEVFLVYDGLEVFPEYAATSTIIFYKPSHQTFVTIEAATTTKSEVYCLYMVDDTYGDLRYCGINVFWAEEDLFDQYFVTLPSCASSCDEMASSSGSTWDDFRYGIECGLAKSFCYMARPSQDSLDTIKKSNLQLQHSFPMTIIFDPINIAIAAMASSTASSTKSFGIPMIRQNGTSTELYLIPVLSSSTISAAIGEDNNNLIRQILSWLGWIAVAVIAAYVVFKFR
jgi:hypothetical protein